MAEFLARIPLYPVLPVIFLVAAVVFVLQMGRHLRIFATARPATVSDAPEARFASLMRYAIVQVRMCSNVLPVDVVTRSASLYGPCPPPPPK